MNPTKQQLVAFFSGLLSPDKKRQIEDWLAGHPDDALVEECIRIVLETQSDRNSNTGAVPEDTLRAHDRFQEWIAREQRGQSGILRRRHFLRFAAAAAILLVFSLTALQVYRHTHPAGDASGLSALPGQKVFYAARAAITRIALPDGTIAWLFPGSSLTTSDSFSTRDRIVALKGRGYFDVAHNSTHPFYVRSGDISTRVLGTAFDVNMSQKNDTRIVVKEGKVEVAGADSILSALTPGQGISIDRATGRWNVRPVDVDEYCSWTKGELGFRQVALKDILSTLELWFNVSFQVKRPELADKKLTFFIRRQNVQEAMDVLSSAAGFRYQIAADTIIIY